MLSTLNTFDFETNKTYPVSLIYMMIIIEMRRCMTSSIYETQNNSVLRLKIWGQVIALISH